MNNQDFLHKLRCRVIYFFHIFLQNIIDRFLLDKDFIGTINADIQNILDKATVRRWIAAPRLYEDRLHGNDMGFDTVSYSVISVKTGIPSVFFGQTVLLQNKKHQAEQRPSYVFYVP